MIPYTLPGYAPVLNVWFVNHYEFNLIKFFPGYSPKDDFSQAVKTKKI